MTTFHWPAQAVRISSLGAILTAWGSLAAADPFSLDLKSRDPASGEVRITRAPVDPGKTAVVVIDMWDRHWCRTYTARVAGMVPRMNQTLQAARRLGLQIVFAPSDVVGFYADHPARKAMVAIPTRPEPAIVPFDPPPQPEGQDCCECGPDRPCRNAAVWTRQQAELAIVEGDLIADCNHAHELFSLCQERGIDTLIYMGVASNMCVQHRDSGMRNARRHGFRVLFVSDLVEAITANGIDPVTHAEDWNFTPAKGSARITRYLEQHVGSSFESRQLLALAHPAADTTSRRPHVVFVIAEDEYRTWETLPKFARDHLEPRYRCTFLHARAEEGPGRNDIPGLDALHDADLLVLSMRRRALPVAQMDDLERYLRAGKPLVVVRLGIVPFQAEPKDRPDGHVIWRAFDEEVLGCHYRGYNAKARETGTDVWAESAAVGHPILRGLETARFHTPMWIYRVNPLATDATVLWRGRWSAEEPEEPVAWARLHQGARVFYTTLGHWQDFDNDQFTRLLANAVHWAVGG